MLPPPGLRPPAHPTPPANLLVPLLRLLTRQLLPALLAVVAWGFDEELDFLCDIVLLGTLGCPVRQPPASGDRSAPPGPLLRFRSRPPRPNFRSRRGS
ncbi:hypothetical protein J4D99_20280 [Siccationidurans ginsengisoli]|uniref:hypothetical protein n=1 Tax=Hymenobacter TaxID=89966 RepID=UPI001AADEAE1|nr:MULTISPECIES: hypothetical protein [unclassified Hymenobacter]MBO2033741.1 hypothetical protein [Hymenobacter sp. BT559]